MPFFRRTILASALALLSAAAAPLAAHEIKLGNLVVIHPWAREASNGEMNGYMKIANHGSEDDRLVGATASIGGRIVPCDMREGDRGELAGGILLPAGKTVALSSKSFHIIFRDVTSQPTTGPEISGTLTFERAGTLQVEFEVDEPR